MDIKNILNEIEVLKTNNPDKDVFFGKKIVGGKITDENSIVFAVNEKKSVNELSEDEILPKVINVDGEELSTDVIKKLTAKNNICPSNFNDECLFSSPENFLKHRPLVGGISIRKTTGGDYGQGTMGFLAIHSDTGALVAVSNLHVIALYHFLAADIEDECQNGGCDLNYNTLLEQMFQPGESPADEIEENNIGRVMYCKLLPDFGSFEIDCGLIALKPEVISNTESFKQLNLSFDNVPLFATTEEINSLVIDNIPLAASGRSSGHKEGSLCGLKAVGLNVPVNTYPYYKNDGSDWSVPFSNQIQYSRMNSQCPNPSIGGDSGSAIMGNFNGVWKIVGLNYAGGSDENGNEYGFFNRIDKVAEQMGIEPWDGTTPNFIDLNNYEVFYSDGYDGDLTKSINGETFWQVGLV